MEISLCYFSRPPTKKKRITQREYGILLLIPKYKGIQAGIVFEEIILDENGKRVKKVKDFTVKSDIFHIDLSDMML